MFERGLLDVIKGLRSCQSGEEEAFIQKVYSEIQKEVKSTDLDIKSQALAKLTHLSLYGISTSWAGFNALECMASNNIIHKKIGYDAAIVCIGPTSEFSPLGINQIRKDLFSTSEEACLALNVLPHLVDETMAEHMIPDLVKLLSHTKPIVRQRALLVLYRFFIVHPESIRLAFPKMKDLLQDSDPRVVSAALNVFCELSRKNPQAYIILSPLLFDLLKCIKNNWLIIKLIKMFTSFCYIEPRLLKKIEPVLVQLLKTNDADSVHYECFMTLFAANEQPLSAEVIELSLNILKKWIRLNDSNVKYLGLNALHYLLKKEPSLIQGCRRWIFGCLQAGDEHIRELALDMVEMTMTEETANESFELILQYIYQTADLTLVGGWSDVDRQRLGKKFIYLASKDGYSLVLDFEWYVQKLLDIGQIAELELAELVSLTLMDLSLRVPDLLPFIQDQFKLLFFGPHSSWNKLLEHQDQCLHLISASAWIFGEHETMEGLKNRELILEQWLDIYLGQKVIQYSDYISSVSVMSILKFILRNEANLPFNMATLLQTRINQVKEGCWSETFKRIMYLESMSESGPSWSIPAPLRPVGSEAQKSLSFPEAFNVPFNVPVLPIVAEEESSDDGEMMIEADLNQVIEPFPGLLKEDNVLNQLSLEPQPPPPRPVRQYRVIKDEPVEQAPKTKKSVPTLMDPESVALSKVDKLPEDEY